MKIGVDYYPVQWDKGLWSKDAEIMSKTGVKTVRLLGVLWEHLEPEEEKFDFSLLDEIISIFSHFGLEVILITPTNCPPLWLYETHPEIIQVKSDGNKILTDSRTHCCLNTDVFVEHAKKITEALAKHFSANPAVIAWQIDNGLMINRCCCSECIDAFKKWLIDKYDNLENINKSFGENTLTGKFNNIDQIKPPDFFPAAWQNPAMVLDYYRYASESTIKFVNMMTLIIRRESPKSKITVNVDFSGNMPDFYDLFDNLSFVSYDNILPFDTHSSAFKLDLMRGIKESSFMVLDQLSELSGTWDTVSLVPKPNMVKGYALQAIAHGADSVIFHRWRSAATGASMQRYGILDHSNVPGRRFFEFSELCKTVSKLNIIRNTQIVSDIAIVYSPECEYALKIQPQTSGYSYFEQLKNFHSAFMKYGANVDVVSPETDLSVYKIVVAPSLYVNKKSATENLYRFVINGGTLVMTNRSGVKDKNNNYIMETLPTVFKELIGAEVEEFDPIDDNEHTITDYAGTVFKCHQWCDILKLTNAKTYAEYSDDFYRCCPAITMNKYCNGIAYYIGTICNMDFYEDFVDKLMKHFGIPRLKGLPRGIEVTTRTNGIDDYVFFFNNSNENATIGLPKAMYSMIDSVGKDRIDLKPFEMEVVRK